MSDIKMTPVTGSSNIVSHGYDKNNKTLAVAFKDGHVYHYENVPEDEYNNFIGEKSLGKYLHANIKGVYKHKKQ
jgi:hypothetical protein